MFFTHYIFAQVPNKLPKEIKFEETLNKFKVKLKTFLLTEAYYKMKQYIIDRK